MCVRASVFSFYRSVVMHYQILSSYLLAYNQCISIVFMGRIQFPVKQKENDYAFAHMHIVIIINLSFLFHFVCFIPFVRLLFAFYRLLKSTR